LNTISESTIKQSKLAIPTLKGSNSLANQITQIGNLTLRAYYQSELLPLNNNLSSYNEAQDSFTNELKQLKRVVQGENTLLSNLRQVDGVYSSLQNNIKQVFDNRKNNIVQLSTLIDKIDLLEEKADDAATLMLDLADHDLADSTLQRAVGLGEQLETLLNSLVSSSFEYRDLLDRQTTELVEKEMVNMYDDILLSVQEINNELSTNSASDISDQLSSTSNEIKLLVEGTGSIFNHKMAQLKAIDLATERLAAAESDINKVNNILAKQVDLANKTTNDTGILVDNTVSKANTQTIFIAAISIVLAIVIAWFTLISITRPLSRVNEMLNVVASGDLSKKLDETGQDEFAQLSKNCNLLIESLRNLINGIVSRSTQLATAAEQTSAVTSQSTTAIIEQRSQVEQAASATTEMSSTSQSVLSSANDALGEIKQADDEAERVKGISERNRTTIELLANEVEDASQVINKLQQDSASIGSILDVIRGIAEQTNLLALNAAIEAARAGEQGRGFAVVADEVRTLASRTQESTQEIQNMIEVLQSGAEKAVSVMDTGKKQAADCVVQSEEADKALETITHAVHEAFDRSSQIATAAEEQSVVAHEISENLESIVAIAEQTTAGSQQTAESSSEVARLAEELQQSVQEFKL
jgi:methyl-accepting chemotaxis protein